MSFRGLVVSWLVAVGVCAHAATFYVTTGADTTNAGSLRGAIIAANFAGGVNTIVLTNSIYSLTNVGGNEDGCLTGDLDVTNGNLTILGLGDFPATISATTLGDRVFHILPQGQLNLLNLTITGGKVSSNIFFTLNTGDSGGGIYNEGTLLMENCVVSNNASGDGNYPPLNGPGSPGGDGGGIYSSGNMTVIDCVIEGNSSGQGFESPGGNGGGVYSSGICSFENCVIRGNITGDGSGIGFFGEKAGDGGGIYNSGTMSLLDTTVSSNITGMGGIGGNPFGTTYSPGAPGGPGGSGGGVFNSGTLTINGCTLDHNLTGAGGDGHDGSQGGKGGDGGNGAGICNSNGVINISSSTFFANQCGNGGKGGNGVAPFFGPSFGGNGGDGGDGGAVCAGGPVALFASTIAGNAGGSGNTGGDAYAYVGFASPTNGTAGVGGNGGSGGITAQIMYGSVEASAQQLLLAGNHGGAGGMGGQNHLTNNTVQQAASGNGGSFDLHGVCLSTSFNLVGVIDAGGYLTNSFGVDSNFFIIATDLIGSVSKPLDPMLGPLTNNGGLTCTMNLLPGSPAINAGPPFDSYYASLLDQRGQPRLFGLHVDIGAVEYNGLSKGQILSPVLTVSPVFGGAKNLNFTAASNITYQVQASTNLVNWITLGSASENPAGNFNFTDSDATTFARRFYRIYKP